MPFRVAREADFLGPILTPLIVVTHWIDVVREVIGLPEYKPESRILPLPKPPPSCADSPIVAGYRDKCILLQRHTNLRNGLKLS